MLFRRFDSRKFATAFLNSRSNGFQLSVVVEFLSHLIRHIKHIGDLIESRRNPCGVHEEPQLKDRIGDDIQQPLTVVSKHIDDRRRIGRFIVDPHFRRLGELFGSGLVIDSTGRRDEARRRHVPQPFNTRGDRSPTVCRRSAGGSPW